MKVKYVPIVLFLGAMSLLLSSYNDGYTTETNLDRTGAAGTLGCGGTGCHASTATAGVTVSVELDSAGVAVPSYRPGGLYTVKVTGTNTTANSLPIFGFSLSAVKAAGAGTPTAQQAGTWGTLPNGIHTGVTTGALVIVEHATPAQPTTGTGATGTTYVRNIPWTAPAAGTGSVRLYGVINATNGDGNENSADKWNGSNATVTEATSGPSAISDLSDKLHGLTIYPTLMTGTMNVSFDMIETAAVNAQIISMNGQVVKTLMSDESMSQGAVNRSYDVAGLASGIYFIKVQIGDSYAVSKVVKQ